MGCVVIKSMEYDHVVVFIVVTILVKKFLTFYGTRKFITVFRRAQQRSLS